MERGYKISATIRSKSHAGSQETQVPMNEGLLIRLSGVIVCAYEYVYACMSQLMYIWVSVITAWLQSC